MPPFLPPSSSLFLTNEEAMAQMYPYPYYWTVPPSNNTAYLHHSFPEHHHPFQAVRNALYDVSHNVFTDAKPAPRADVRETLDTYFVDVELPGVECREQIKLKWTNSRTLLLEVEKSERGIIEGKGEGKSIGAIGVSLRDTIVEGSTSKPQDLPPPAKEDTKTNGETEKPTQAVHHVLKERDLGKVVRAFHFPVAVSLEKMTAKLHHGMLEITLPKAEEEKVKEEHREVKVEHAGN